MARTYTTWLDAVRQDASLLPAPKRLELWWRFKWTLGRIVCIARRRCEFNTYEFRGDCLYFCTRCAREVTGRTFADIPASDRDERDDFLNTSW